MASAVEAVVQESAISQFRLLDELVEVLDVSNGRQKTSSLPMLQRRAKVAIKTGMLKLSPYGGVMIPSEAMSQRGVVDAHLKALDQSYMRGVKVPIEAIRNVTGVNHNAPHRHDFLIYSPFGEKGLVTINAEGTAPRRLCLPRLGGSVARPRQPRLGQHAAVSRSVQAAPPCGDIFHLGVFSEHEGQYALLDKQCGSRTRSALSPSVRRWLR